MGIQYVKKKLYAPWRYRSGGRDSLGSIEANNRHTLCSYLCPWAGAAVELAPAFLMVLIRIAEIQPPGDRAGELARRAVAEYQSRQALYSRRP